jgi:hypothetical protein
MPTIPDTLEAEIRRLMIQKPPKREKICFEQQKLGGIVPVCHPSYMGRINRRIKVESSQGKKWDPISKITRAKGLGAGLKCPEFKPQYHQKIK